MRREVVLDIKDEYDKYIKDERRKVVFGLR